MSGFWLGSAPGAGNGGGSNRSVDEGFDKLNMSLDEIIKLNRREQLRRRASSGRGRPRMNRGRQQSRMQPFGRRGAFRGMQQQRGAVKNRVGLRGKKPTMRRRTQGVITGLAAKRSGVVMKGISPLNRPPLNQKNVQRFRPVFQRRLPTQRPSEVQRRQTATLRRPPQSKRRNIIIAGVPRNAVPNRTPATQQKAARQATFLFRRGLKVQTQVQTSQGMKKLEKGRTRPWRTSTTSGGIITVSIENPEARTQPIVPLQRPRLTRPMFPPLLIKKDDGEPGQKKIPKGVPLQFDINSIWKQTGMTLNERFKILKDQRTATTQSKGIRLVTVGQSF